LAAQQLELISAKWWPDIEKEYQEALHEFPDEGQRIPRDQRDILEEILISIRAMERHHSPPHIRRNHHLKIKGEQSQIAAFLSKLRSLDFGGQPSVVQQYSNNSAAVNIDSQGPINITKILEAAKQHRIELEWIEMPPEEF
jgi:hypothetical protein